MHLQQLAVKNYKSIASVNIKNFHALDIFIGKNNSGKSNILDAVMIFLQEQKLPGDIFQVENAEIEAAFNFDAPCAACQLTNSATLRCRMQAGQQKSFLLNEQPISEERARNMLKHHIVHINTSRILLEQRRAVDTQIQSGDITYFFVQQAYLELFQQHQPAYQKLLQALQKMFPDISYRPDEKLFDDLTQLDQLSQTKLITSVFEGTNKVQSLANLGAGYLQLFVVLLFLFHPRYSLVVIDEPENHLHIGLQKKLLRIMEQECRQKHLLISTHSPIFVCPQLFQALHRVVKNSEHRTQVYPIHLKRENIDIQRLAQELNLESNEMLFADHVILVEGEADEILLKGLLERFYDGPMEILVLAVHSNTNFKIYRDVLQFFEIPYTIMTDKDSLHGYVDVIQEILGTHRINDFNAKIQILKRRRIYVLPRGALEKHYPRQYQRRDDSKPINALRAAKQITVQELRSERMRPILEVLQSIHQGEQVH